MRNKILDYLKNDRSFQGGLKLYMEYGKNLAFKNILNRQGRTDYNERILMEELRKIAGISEQEYKGIMNRPKGFENKLSEEKPVQEDISEAVEESIKPSEPADEPAAPKPVVKKKPASRKKSKK